MWEHWTGFSDRWEMTHFWKSSRTAWSWFWAVWYGWLGSLQRGWTRWPWPLKVLFNPHYSMILLNWCSYEATTDFSQMSNKFGAVIFLHPWQEGLWYCTSFCHLCTCFWASLADVADLSAGHSFTLETLQLSSCALRNGTKNSLQGTITI